MTDADEITLAVDDVVVEPIVDVEVPITQAHTLAVQDVIVDGSTQVQ